MAGPVAGLDSALEVVSPGVADSPDCRGRAAVRDFWKGMGGRQERAEKFVEPGESLPFRFKTFEIQYEYSQIPQGCQLAGALLF